MADYKALTYVNLPVINVLKAPGDTITDTELEQAGQTADNIQQLVDGGAISSDMNAPIDEAHLPPDAVEGVNDGDDGKGK